MIPTHQIPPHGDRILARLQQLEQPVVQLWGWPGSGKAALLRLLAARQGEAVAWLARDQLMAESGALPRNPWLLAETEPGESVPVQELAAKLRAGQRLVLAGTQKCASPSARFGLIEPAELLLTRDEVATLLASERATALPPVGPGATTLHRATDGWYEPLRLLVAAGLANLSKDPQDLGSIEPLYPFVARTILARLAPEVRATLLELSLADSLSPELWDEVWRSSAAPLARRMAIAQSWGFSVRGAGGERLPRLLAEACRRQLRDDWPISRIEARCRRLALVCYGQDRAEVALRALLFAGDLDRASSLAQLSWLQVWSSVGVSIVRQIVEQTVEQTTEQTAVAAAPQFALLRWSLAAVDGNLGAARAGLEGLAARQRSDPLIAAAAGLALAALNPTPASAAAARDARRELQGGGQTQRGELRMLLQVVEFGRWNKVDSTEVESLAGRLAQLCCQNSDLSPATKAAKIAPLSAAPLSAAPPSLARRAATTAGPASTAGAFEVRLLGVPRVSRLTGSEAGDLGSEEIHWKLRRAFLIFVYLASTAEGRANREAIVEAAWPSADESRVERNFHPTLSHLRRSLRWPAAPASGSGPGLSALEYVNGSYQLNPRIDWRIDSHAFEKLTETGRQRAQAGETEAAVIAYESAWRLYRGPFLEGFYESWVEERREALSALYLDSLRRLGELHQQMGNVERAIDGFRAVLATDPLQEGVHLSIMRIYAQQGRRDLVRRQYDRLTQLLRDELLVEPMEETTREYQRLMG